MTKWAEIINEAGSVGILWESDGDFGFAPNDTEDNGWLAFHIIERETLLNDTDFDSNTKFEVLFDWVNSYQSCLSLMSEGDSEELHALVAAATPKQYSSEELSSLLQPTGKYSLTLDDNKNVIGLAWEEADEVRVRENGEWVDFDLDDPRYYGGTIKYVKPEATELYDKIVQKNPTPPASSFREVYLG